MNRMQKNIIKGILSVVSLAVVGCAVFLFAGQPLLSIVKSNYVQVAVKGQPQSVVREKTVEKAKSDNNGKTQQGKAEQGSLHTEYGIISCESIDLNVPLYFGDTEENLYYGACIYAGGSTPGKPGTTLISAHNVTYFKPLEKVKEKDVIKITTMDKVYKYQVDRIDITEDYKSFTVSKEKNDEHKLVLYTCYPFHIAGEKTSKRFFVYCSLVKGKRGGN